MRFAYPSGFKQVRATWRIIGALKEEVAIQILLKFIF